MAEDKYYVYLTHSMMISTLGGKQMTESEIEKYLQDLSECYAEIPQSSCLHSLSANFNRWRDTELHLGNNWNRKDNFTRTHSGVLNIRIDIKACSKCHRRECMKNIETGKCLDDFVRTVIGKKLFPEKYGQQR